VKLLPWVFLSALVLSGCAPADPNPAPPPETSMETETTEPSPRSAPGPCDVVNERAMGETIGAQITALRAGDYAAAYEWAAPAFQMNVPLEVFEIVIQDGYSSLLESRSHTLSDCVLFPQDLGNTVVTVRTVSGEVFTYYYEMINTDQGWRILGAAEIAPVSSGA
jgi:hypothetical protein